MKELKTKGIKRIEERLEDVGGDERRRFILECAKNFKTSWIELGRALYKVQREKLYRNWGYNTFEGYAAKEIGVQKQTAMKLMRSYMFLEREEPWYLNRKEQEDASAIHSPHYEAIDVLRIAKGKKQIEAGDYERLKKRVFQDGKDHHDVKKELTSLIKQREEIEPDEARQKSRHTVIRRFISNLKSAEAEMEALKLIPQKLINETKNLIAKIEEYL
ncbi:MAG: hypothetical protein KKH94_02105 [Candidatus Omnitrophica bacterium]|nr:hypothetical protein [Candidatus Omnitrophota bacterium]